VAVGTPRPDLTTAPENAMRILSLPASLRPVNILLFLAAGLMAYSDAGLLREAVAAEPQPIVVRGRRLPVLPGRAARMAARGEIFAVVPPPAQAPIVIREQAPPVVIREQAAASGLREQVREAVAAAIQAAGKAPAAVNPPAAATAANPNAAKNPFDKNPFDKQGVEPASVLVPQPPKPQPPTPQPADKLPPIELLPTP